MSSPVIVWFRRDFRLADNPALWEAVKPGVPVVPVYIHAPEEESPWQPGEASLWWLHHSLTDFAKRLRNRGSQLIIRSGETLRELRALVSETGAAAVYWNRLYDPATIERDKSVKAALKEANVEVRSFNGALLFEPWTVENKSGQPFQVFTPFWKHCTREFEPPDPLPARRGISTPDSWPATRGVKDLDLLPKIPWDSEFHSVWSPGEEGARNNIKSFLKNTVSRYSDDRNRPDLTGTSRLSPHLHFGEITPRQVWHEIRKHEEKTGSKSGTGKYLAEIGWREFAHHLVYHFPHTTTRPLRADFEEFPWRESESFLHVWQRGMTGYPIVDAGMRELWTTGWMHNRVRMIVASFLVKHLRLHWTHGTRWFWDTLVDADLASNTMGWQWSAGCGADAAPYFRIFNPMLQGAKFDPKGEYVRKWVPEIQRLPVKHLNAPWETPAAVLNEAGVRLGETYPKPLVDHKTAREEALAAFATIRKK